MMRISLEAAKENAEDREMMARVDAEAERLEITLVFDLDVAIAPMELNLKSTTEVGYLRVLIARTLAERGEGSRVSLPRLTFKMNGQTFVDPLSFCDHPWLDKKQFSITASYAN